MKKKLNDIPWQLICYQQILNKQKLTSNAITSKRLSRHYNRQEVYVPLGLLERKLVKRYQTKEPVKITQENPGIVSSVAQHIIQLFAKPFFKTNQSTASSKNQEASQSENPLNFSHSTHEETIVEINQVHEYSNNEFLEQVLRRSLSPKSQGKRLAVIGEPGSGKTTLLQQMALWVAQEIENSISIWISLADLQGQDLESYLFNTWLRSVFRRIPLPNIDYIAMENSFKALLTSCNVFVFLDGVDEMSYSQGLANPLREIGSQIEQAGCLVHTRIILSCRLNLWDNEFYTLHDFDVFKTLTFSYPDQVELFIHRYFLPYDASADQQQGSSLCSQLRQQSNHRVQELVRNPLCLTLLCWNWFHQDGKNHLPDTKAGLYSQFVESLYRWESDGKKYKLSVTAQQLKQLTKKIGLLARYCWENESTRFRFPEDLLARYLGDASDEHSFFNLVLSLGWINKIGEDANNERKFVYAFFHPSFTEYFAALSINDRRFFLNHIPWNPTHRRASYRIFDEQWREVYLLWLGRDELSLRMRLRLISALINFRDGWQGFYQYKAFFLAALGYNELTYSNDYNRIIRQIIQWSLFDNTHLSFRDGKEEVAYLSTSSTEALRSYGISDIFLDGFDDIWENPLRWKDRQTIARYCQKVLQELEIHLSDKDKTRVIGNIEQDFKISNTGIRNDLGRQHFFKNERFNELNSIRKDLFTRPGQLPENMQKNINWFYHRRNIDSPIDDHDDHENISKIVPKLVLFLKAKTLGSIQFKNSTLILNWKRYVEFLIQLAMDNVFVAFYLADVFLTFSGIEKQEKDKINPKLEVILECFKEIMPIDYKVEILLRVLKYSYEWIHDDKFDRYSCWIGNDIHEAIPEESVFKYKCLDVNRSLDCKLDLSRLELLTNEISETLQADKVNLRENECIYSLWLNIINLLSQDIITDTTGELKNLHFIHEIQFCGRFLLRNSAQADIIIFSLFKDIVSPDNIDGMLGSLPIDNLPEFTIDYLKGHLVNNILNKSLSNYYLLFNCAPKIPCYFLLNSFSSVQSKALLMLQRSYTYLKRDLHFKWDVAKKRTEKFILNFLLRLFPLYFAWNSSEFINLLVNLLIIILTWPFISAASIFFAILLKTRASHNKIQTERRYYHLIRSKWHTFDARSRKTLILIMERMADSASRESQALNNRGIGIIAFCIFFTALLIPPISQFANRLTVVSIELIVHLCSELIKSPEIYLLYLRQYNLSNLNFGWLQQLGVNTVVLILVILILQPDKDLGQEIVAKIRRTRLNSFRGQGFGHLIKKLIYFFSISDSTGQRDLAQSLNYIENQEIWNTLSDDHQFGAVFSLIGNREYKSSTPLPDRNVIVDTITLSKKVKEIATRTFLISLSLLFIFDVLHALSLDVVLGALMLLKDLRFIIAYIFILSFFLLVFSEIACELL